MGRRLVRSRGHSTGGSSLAAQGGLTHPAKEQAAGQLAGCYRTPQVNSLGSSGRGQVLADSQSSCFQLLRLVDGLHWTRLCRLDQETLDQHHLFLPATGLLGLCVVDGLNRGGAIHHHLLQDVSERVLVGEQNLGGLQAGQPLLLLSQQGSVDVVRVVRQHLPLVLVNLEVL